MPVNPGYKGKFCLGAHIVGEITSVEIGGISYDLSDATALQDAFKKYAYGVGDGGGITLNGYLDTTDTNGQIALMTATENRTILSVANSNDPRVYVNETQYFELSTGAEALIKTGNKIGNVDAGKSGLATISWELQVSGGYMKLHTA